MLTIDTHHHLIPPDYRKAMQKAGIDNAGGAVLPEWSVERALETMATLEIGTAILSITAPGTAFLPNAADAAALARDVNDYSADLVRAQPDRFGFFATLPMPHVDAATTEAVRALDELRADGVVLLANSGGTYLGDQGQDALFAELDRRSAVVFVHPAALPGPPAAGIPPFAADFLLDTTRAAYLLVRNGIRQRYPRIRFILSHGGGFVPYASHRLAGSIQIETGRNLVEALSDFASFYFDVALTSTAAALPTLLAFADPGRLTYGSDWPFAALPFCHYCAAGLRSFKGLDQDALSAIYRTNALSLFPRLGAQEIPKPNGGRDG